MSRRTPAKPRPPKLTTFDLKPGRKLGPRYVVESLLGRGTEGEVYSVRELDTGVRRAAKIYFPHKDPTHVISIRHAQKLEALRHCPIVLQYHHTEFVTIRRQRTIAMISELAEGEQLQRWVERHRGKRLAPYQALHVLYNLARGLEAVHVLGEYHADVHTENILIRPSGVRFTLKLVDFYDWGRPAKYKQRQDVFDTVKVFWDCLGRPRGPAYTAMPDECKTILAGLNRTLILRRYPTVTALRRHLESFEWQGLL